MYPILSCTGDRIFRCCVHAFGMFFCSLYGSRPNAVLCGNALTISHVAVADIQINSKLLLCHFSIFSEVSEYVHPLQQDHNTSHPPFLPPGVGGASSPMPDTAST